MHIPSHALKTSFVKFQNVSSITIFIESNQAGEAKTAIQRLRFIGQSQTATDMKEFKRVRSAFFEDTGDGC